MKKEVAKRFLYNTHFKHAQDYELWTRMALNSVRMTNLPEIVLRYRIHGTQISQAKKELQTNLRMKITREYWQNSPLSHDLAFHTCLMDEREIIDHEKFRSVIRSLKTVEARLTDDQAIAAINHHRIWFIYRSINLGHQAILPAVKNLRLSKLKRIAIAMLSFFRAGCLISYFRHAQWLRHLQTPFGSRGSRRPKYGK
ncbi:MAG: hypothetical protein BWZ05_02022 [Bacteroidetes bacterium ADurb.BinA245]|nr:MAG: hypothetical protein BWZ05_02022 [Bacteroidetes bacterium ADurb.BinA245]